MDIEKILHEFFGNRNFKIKEKDIRTEEMEGKTIAFDFGIVEGKIGFQVKSEYRYEFATTMKDELISLKIGKRK